MSDMMGIKLVGDAATDPSSSDFAMYSDEGNAIVAKVVNLVSLFLGQTPAAASASALSDALAEVAKTYPEVRDTMVRETIFSALEAQWLFTYGETATLAGAFA